MDVAGYMIRPFVETDRAATLALGQHVVDWWNKQCPTLHLVAEHAETGDLVAHLQIADRSLPEPSRRPGECNMRLTVALEHRSRSLGAALYARAEAFARERRAVRITASYFEGAEGEPTAAFLSHRGFVPYERYHPSQLDLADFDPERFADAITRVEQQRVHLFTYAEVGDTADRRRMLFELECAAHSVQPFREVGDYVPPDYEGWEQEMTQWPPETIFLAATSDNAQWIGLITSLEWGFTGVHPDWQGRGIATALKVRSLTVAKARGLTCIDTENHEDNRAMLAINRKLGFMPGPVEVNCVCKL